MRSSARATSGRTNCSLLCFSKEDRIGIDLGDNADEYEPEVGSILPKLASCRGLDDIQAVVHCEFCAWFGADIAGPSERYARIASRIHGELSEFGGWPY